MIVCTSGSTPARAVSNFGPGAKDQVRLVRAEVFLSVLVITGRDAFGFRPPGDCFDLVGLVTAAIHGIAYSLCSCVTCCLKLILPGKHHALIKCEIGFFSHWVAPNAIEP
jgi:hypothetical protein